MVIKGGVYHLRYSHNEKNYCFIFFLSNSIILKEHFNVKRNFFYIYGKTEVDLHGEMWVMSFLRISANKTIIKKSKKKEFLFSKSLLE